MSLHAGRPDEGPRRDPRPVREHGLPVVDGGEHRRDVDLDAAPHELLRRVLAQPRRDLGEDLRRRIDEDPALGRVAQPREVPHRRAHEVGELCERLDARIPGADEDEAEVPLHLLRVGCGVGGLEFPQHVVAELDGVGEILERKPVLGQARDRERARNRPERDHQPIPGEREVARVGRLHRHGARGLVDRRDPTEDELGLRAHLSQRHDDVTGLDRAGRRLRQERCVEHGCLRADDRRSGSAEQPRDIAAGEAAADHESSASGAARLGHDPILPQFGFDKRL